MKKLLAVCFILGTLSSYAQSVVTAEKTMEFADLCYFKQVQMKGYAYLCLGSVNEWNDSYLGSTTVGSNA